MSFKKIIGLALILVSISSFSTEPERGKDKNSKDSKFTLLNVVPATSVKNQNKTGTCWSFSAISMVESELLRTENKAYNLSEMFIVRNVYGNKAEKYVRMHGNINFAAGGEPNDVIDVIRENGIVPDDVYTGLIVDTAMHFQFEMDEVLQDYVKAIVRNPNKKLTSVWTSGFMGIIDNYLGDAPQEFEYEGTSYTPESFAKSLDFNPDDYIMISSFNHHPFYSSFVIEIPDNWSWGKVYNLPLDEFTHVADYALENGYSMVWSADVSEKGFMFDEGVALAPKVLYQPDSQDEFKKVSKLTSDERSEFFSDMENPIRELSVTQTNRQKGFDDYSTADDHGMHLLGKGEDINGKKYYYIKNSWGSDNEFGGYMYISESYFKYKTISIMLNKKALPKNILEKLNIDS